MSGSQESRRTGKMPAVSLLIRNMHCPSCCEAIRQLLDPLPAVRDLSIDLLRRTVNFAIDVHATHPPGEDGRLAVKLGDVYDEVVRLLYEEGGFEVEGDRPGGPPSAHKQPTKARQEGHGLFGWKERSREKREREEEKARRERHLEHCSTCQAEAAGDHASDEAAAADGSSDPDHKAKPAPQTTSKSGGTVRTTLSIEGMTCASCTRAITNMLKDLPGVTSAEVNLLSASALVMHEDAVTSEDVAEAVEDAGFEAKVIDSVRSQAEAKAAEATTRTTLSIDGMTCASCTGSIRQALEKLDGIERVDVDLLGHQATVLHNDSITPAAIQDEIEDIGFGANVIKSEPVTKDRSGKGAVEINSPRTVNIRIKGMFCGNCVKQVNALLGSLPLKSFTLVTLDSPTVSVTYMPREPLVVRDILKKLDNLAPEFEAEVVREQNLTQRSQEIQRREVVKLVEHLAVAILFAIPAFIIMIVGMVILPPHHPFRMIWERPVWGAANLGTVIMWPLATVVQFGVGRLFHVRAYHSLRGGLRNLIPRRFRSKSGPATKITLMSFFSFGSMDLLVVLSTSVAYFASLAMLIIDVRNPPSRHSIGSYFDSSIFLIMFILLGRSIEAYAKSRTTDAMTLLGQLRPETALLVSPPSADGKSPDDGETLVDAADPVGASSQSGPVSVPVEELEKGDLILIPPGSLPATDGIVVSGTTTFDESSLTGESRPISKQPGDEIFTGTSNLTGAITIRVSKLGGETMLEKIIAAVSDASARKAPIEKLAERLTGVFVPIIVYLALLDLAIWLAVVLTGHADTSQDMAGGRVFFAIEFAISVLVVACPCGIGLAVPCANAVGNGIAAKAGVLASGGGEAWLAATKVSTIVFDKTGTLTVGKSVVTDEEYIADQLAESVKEEEVKAAVYAVESASTHPLAAGLVEHLSESLENKHEVTVTRSAEIAGRGMSATVQVNDQSIDVLVGNLALMHQHIVRVQPHHLSTIKTWSEQAKSIVLVASRRSQQEVYALSAMYSLSDPPRETTADTVRLLQSRGGIQVCMLSGDNETTANAVGKMVGIPAGNVRAGVGPEGKAEAIREWQALKQIARPPTIGVRLRRAFGLASPVPNEVVMFVGDGLNDSVALAAADVSVAMGHGSQSTLASADFVLLSSNLATLDALLRISKKVYNRQRLNLLWAVMFNFVCIPFAAGVFYPAGGIRLSPVWSAILMALSSVSVVLSSLALRWGL